MGGLKARQGRQSMSKGWQRDLTFPLQITSAYIWNEKRAFSISIGKPEKGKGNDLK